MRSYEVLATPRTDTYHAFMFVMKEWQLGKRDLANRPHGLALRGLRRMFCVTDFRRIDRCRALRPAPRGQPTLQL